jgi:hypothetical protein
MMFQSFQSWLLVQFPIESEIKLVEVLFRLDECFERNHI